MSKTPSIPAVPKSADPETRRFFEAVKQLVEVRNQNRGDPDDRFVTVGELADADIIALRATISAGFDRSPRISTAVATATNVNPDVVTNVTTGVTPTSVLVQWDYSFLAPASYFEIYRAVATDANASQQGQQGYTPDWQASLSNAQVVGVQRGHMYIDQNFEAGQRYIYWVRAIGPTGLAGAYDSTDGTLAETEADIFQAIADASTGITESHLTQTLLDDLPSLSGLSSEYVLKVANTAGTQIAGFGLAASNDSPSEFIIRADKFGVVQSDGTGSTITPFVVNDDGDVVVNSAIIDTATIDTANITGLTGDNIDVASLSAIETNLGTINAGVLQSSDGLFVIHLNDKYIYIQ